MNRPWQSNKFTQNAATTNIPTTVETVLATIGGVSTQSADSTVNLEGTVAFVPGTGATSLALRIRRGVDATGTVIGTAVPVPCTAGVTVFADMQVQDVPGEVAGQSYVITVAQAAATGNGTNTLSALQASY